MPRLGPGWGRPSREPCMSEDRWGRAGTWPGPGEPRLDPECLGICLLLLHTVSFFPGLIIAHVLQVAVLWGRLPLLIFLIIIFLLLVPRELGGLGSQLLPVCSQTVGPLEFPAC